MFFGLLLASVLSTVLNTNTSSSYSCDGVQTTYSIGFPYGAASEIVVTATTPAGVKTTLVITTDYVLSQTSTQTTATLILTAGSKCPNLSTLRIARSTPLTQPVNLRIQGPLRPETLESMYDRLTRQVQEIKGSVPNLGKGQMLVGSDDGTKVLAQGSAGQVLTADPTQSYGVAWYAGTSGSNFTASGVGAVVRTQASKFGDIIAAKDYGVIGAGIVDEAPAMNVALTAAAGKTLRIQPGTYLYGSTMNDGGADSSIVCDGLCTFTPTGGFVGPTFTIRHNNVAVVGITFSGVGYALDVNGVVGFLAFRNRVVSNTAAGGLGIISSSSEIQVLDNRVDSGTGICLSLHGNTDAIVRGNIFILCTDDAIAVRALLTTTNDQTVIANNVIDDAGKAGIKLTVETSSVAGAQNMRASITNNVIKKWGRNVAEAGISINNLLVDGSTNQNISVANNTLESANRTLENSYISAIAVKDVAITGNVMRGGVNASGIVTQASSYVNITGNIVADPIKVSAATNIGGITVLTSKYGSITGNTIRNPGKAANNRPGIYIEQSQYFSIIGNVSVDDQGGSATMSSGIEMNSAGAVKNDYNTLIGNVSTGHLVAAVNFNSAALANHQIALGNQDGASGGITLLAPAGAAKTSGLRNATTRNITRNSSVAPVDCAAGNIAATVTQELDGGIFTCATVQNLTTARADGTSGIVQALPGIPAVGDVFQFVMSATAANNFTLVGGLNTTIVGNAAVNNSSRIVVCRVTSVTAAAETITCYL